jgi:hypothetical protein
MTFQAVVLPDIVAIPVPTAEKLATLAQAGLPVGVFGQQPMQQPGYQNYVENDRRVQEHVQAILDQPKSTFVADQDALANFLGDLPSGPIRYEANPALRTIRRRLGNGQHLAFVRNTSGDPADITFALDASLRAAYWLDARPGNIYAAALDGSQVTGWLPGFGSMALLCGPEPVFPADAIAPGSPVQQPVVAESIPLADWTLQVVGDDVPGGTYTTTTAALGDWSQHDDLKYVSSVGHYTTTFTLGDLTPGKRYVLDLGQVFAAADVIVNGHDAGHAIFAPYQVDVTGQVVAGDNTVEIAVTPALRNRLLGKALAGDPEYAQFVARGPFANPNPVASGLVGPVTLLVVEPSA